MKTQFALTHINQDGMRQLTRPNQGRNHFSKLEDAENYFACLFNNSQTTLAKVYGKQSLGTFRIDPVECFDNGDAVGIYIRDPKAPFDIEHAEYLAK